MSNTLRRRFNGTLVWDWLQRLGAILTVAAIAAFGFWGGHFLLPGQEHAEFETGELEAQSSSESNQITLPPQKLAAANLVSVTIEEAEFQAHKAIPGSVNYDSTKKVEIRATVNSTVKETLVKPNQRIEKGEPMLVLTSPEIGAAKNDISRCEASVNLLTQQYRWIEATHASIDELLTMLQTSPSSQQIKAKFENKKLGEHRDEILTAYAELSLARQLSLRTDSLISQGAISGKEGRQRSSALDVASAKFNAIAEEMTFQTTQQLTQAIANLEAEKKRLAICEAELSAMLGSNSDAAPESIQTMSPSEFVFSAPQRGQVVNLQAVQSARFAPGEVMAEIADTSDVWIEAQVSQRDWHSVSLQSKQELTVRIPGLPAEKFTATVKHIDAAVSKETMAIPLVAELNNPDGKFRPGMAVWVEVPVSKNRRALVVPEGAVQRNEQNAFVFVQTNVDSFEKRDVVIGEEADGVIEITSGIESGDQVVVEGAFFLKSEMLLAEEE